MDSTPVVHDRSGRSGLVHDHLEPAKKNNFLKTSSSSLSSFLLQALGSEEEEIEEVTHSDVERDDLIIICGGIADFDLMTSSVVIAQTAVADSQSDEEDDEGLAAGDS